MTKERDRLRAARSSLPNKGVWGCLVNAVRPVVPDREPLSFFSTKPKTLVLVELWDESERAVEAVAQTFASLHPAGQHRLARTMKGWAVETTEPDFIRFCAVRQGYVKAFR